MMNIHGVYLIDIYCSYDFKWYDNGKVQLFVKTFSNFLHKFSMFHINLKRKKSSKKQIPAKSFV